MNRSPGPTKPKATASSCTTVFYDGECPLCSREIAHYRSMRGAERIEWVDITTDHQKLREQDLSIEQAMMRFHVLDRHGAWHTGAYGFVELWRNLPALRYLAWLLEKSRLLKLADGVYNRFAQRRLKHRTRGHLQ